MRKEGGGGGGGKEIGQAFKLITEFDTLTWGVIMTGSLLIRACPGVTAVKRAVHEFKFGLPVNYAFPVTH